MMLTFKQFLLESTQEPKLDLEWIKSYVAKSGNEKRIGHYLPKFIKLKDELYAAGEIPNPSFVELKEAANRFIEDIYDPLGSEYFHAGKYKDLPEDMQNLNFDWPSGTSQLKSFSKKIEKLSKESKKHPLYNLARELTDKLLPMAEIIEYAKAHVYKISDRKKEEKANAEKEKQNYLKPILSAKSYKMMVDLVQKTSDGVKQDLYKARLSVIEKIGEKLEKSEQDNSINLYDVFDARSDSYELSISHKLTDEAGYRKASLKSTWKSIAKDLAMQEAQDILRKFVSKTTDKLGVIVGRKNNLKTIKVIDAKAGPGYVWCDLSLMFEDSSSFTMETKAVYSYSKYGKLFVRFPTTFHNVKLPDGSKMSNPSEERMDTIFSKT